MFQDAGIDSFSVDDDLTGKASDVYNIQVTVKDDDSGVASAGAVLTVKNVAPTLTNVAATPEINEDDTATLTGTITDPGTKDKFTLEVDWGDGSTDTYDYAAGTASFAETHQYLDDNVSDRYDIGITLIDDDGGKAGSSA